ncbi:MAG TPA: UxaA family hydrolase, partial [Mobilitalea sp.]|nr:UxaA family hydrolase [Mobilitalea sp.]
MQDYIKINKKDNVAVSMKELIAGISVVIDDRTITIIDHVPAGHKFSLTSIGKGEQIIKYGFPIGRAKEKIELGSWIHTHNVQTNLSDIIEYTYQPEHATLPTTEEAYFEGYRRPDGKVGIRNQIWIIPTVGCVNSIADLLAKRANEALQSEEEIIAFSHPYGCS